MNLDFRSCTISPSTEGIPLKPIVPLPGILREIAKWAMKMPETTDIQIKLLCNYCPAVPGIIKKVIVGEG